MVAARAQAETPTTRVPVRVSKMHHLSQHVAYGPLFRSYHTEGGIELYERWVARPWWQKILRGPPEGEMWFIATCGMSWGPDQKQLPYGKPHQWATVYNHNNIGKWIWWLDSA